MKHDDYNVPLDARGCLTLVFIALIVAIFVYGLVEAVATMRYILVR